MKTKISRREGLKLAGLGLLAGAGIEPGLGRNRTSGGINQSVCRWCYKDIPLDQLAEAAAKMGYQSIELIGPDDFPTVKKYGLTCAMTWGAGPINDCLNRTENHPRCEEDLKKAIDFAAAEGLPNVICFSGNRDGMDDEEGLENCLTGLKRIVGYAEKNKVTICLELLNSKVDHKDYMADKSEWGIRLAKRVGSEHFKLLYDIYHMQIMEGDVIRTIRENHQYFAHYHTGGVPGRNEIDQNQELFYPAIMQAILDTGYTGYVGQEFVPKRDPLTSMKEAFGICDI